MNKKNRIYVYGLAALSGVFFFTIVFPYITDFFYYLWAKNSAKGNYLFINEIYSTLTATGFALMSAGVIGYAVFSDSKKKFLKKISLFILFLGIVTTSLFVITKPVNDRFGFLKEKNGDVYMYTGFHVKNKIIFIKKEKIFSKDINKVKKENK